MIYPYLSGEKVTLKSIQENEIEKLLAIENESQLRVFGDDDIPYPFSKEALTKFLQVEAPNQVFGIYLNEDDRLVGNIAIYNVNQQNLNCEIGLVISELHQGKGLGSEATQIVIDFIFNYLPMQKIKLDVFSFNKSAISLYRKMGFKHEGTLRNELFRFGNFQDMELFGLLRTEWEKSKQV
ncbi:GNAT family N-acetyltransferase [Enterococcus sp. LJL99]